MNASKIMTSVFGTLVSNFYDNVNYALYDIARDNGNWNFEMMASDIKDKEFIDFMEINEVPDCKIAIRVLENGCNYEILINGENGKFFDWEVSDKVEKLHADDYEISKDRLYEDYDDDYDDNNSYEETFDSSKYMMSDEDYYN